MGMDSPPARPVRVFSDGWQATTYRVICRGSVYALGKRCRWQDVGHDSARSSLIVTDLDVGVPLASGAESNGNNTLVSGK